jgi:hypothetical protein
VRAWMLAQGPYDGARMQDGAEGCVRVLVFRCETRGSLAGQKTHATPSNLRHNYVLTVRPSLRHHTPGQEAGLQQGVAAGLHGRRAICKCMPPDTGTSGERRAGRVAQTARPHLQGQTVPSASSRAQR